jgi:hypothetical protein
MSQSNLDKIHDNHIISHYLEEIENISSDIVEYGKDMDKFTEVVQKVLKMRGFRIVDLENYYELFSSKKYTKKNFDFVSGNYIKEQLDETLFFIEEKIDLDTEDQIEVFIKFHLIGNVMSILDFTFNTKREDTKLRIFKLLDELRRKTTETQEVQLKEEGRKSGFKTIKNYARIFVCNMREEDEDLLVKCREAGYIDDYVAFDLLNNTFY